MNTVLLTLILLFIVICIILQMCIIKEFKYYNDYHSDNYLDTNNKIDKINSDICFIKDNTGLISQDTSTIREIYNNSYRKLLDVASNIREIITFLVDFREEQNIHKTSTNENLKSINENVTDFKLNINKNIEKIDKTITESQNTIVGSRVQQSLILDNIKSITEKQNVIISKLSEIIVKSNDDNISKEEIDAIISKIEDVNKLIANRLTINNRRNKRYNKKAIEEAKDTNTSEN